MTQSTRSTAALSTAVCIALCAALAPLLNPASARQADPRRRNAAAAAAAERDTRVEDARPGAADSRPQLNLGTGVPLAFVEDKPAAGTRTRLVGTSLGSASISFTSSSIEFALKRNGGDPAASVSQQFVGADASASPAGASPTGGVTNVISGPDPKNWRTNLKQYSAVSYGGLYGGVGARFEGNGRILKGTYTFAPRAGAGRVGWRYPGAARLAQDKRTGNVKVFVPAVGGQRVLTLRSPSARQARGRVAAQYLVDKDALTLSLKGYNPAEELVVETELMYSRHFDDYDARAASDGTYVVGSVPSAGAPRGRAAERDAFVARLDAKGAAVLRLNILDGGADDAATGLAVSPGGDLYVGGKTSSRGLPVVRPLQEANRGGYDAFVWRFRDGGSRLVGGTYLGGAFDDAIEALAINCKGEVAVTGTAGHDFPARSAARTSFATLFPVPAEGTAECPGRFVGQLGPALDSVKAVEFFTAPAPSQPVRMWKGRNCLLVIGVPVVGQSCVAQADYDIGAQYDDPAFYTDPYINHSQPPYITPVSNTGWGYHALRWKALKNPGSVYTPPAAGAVNTYQVAGGDEALLNNAEVSAFFPPDPGGVWQSNYAGSLEALALGAAYYAFRWGSPVYTNRQCYLLDAYGNRARCPVAVERVTFCVYETTQGAYQPGNPAHKLDALCDFNNVAPGSLTVGCLAWAGFNYEVEEVRARTWGEEVAYYMPLSAYPNDNALPQSDRWFAPGTYIGDPPEGEAHLAELFGDAADQLRGAFVTKAELDYRVYDAGRPARATRLSGRVRVADLRGADR